MLMGHQGVKSSSSMNEEMVGKMASAVEIRELVGWYLLLLSTETVILG